MRIRSQRGTAARARARWAIAALRSGMLWSALLLAPGAALAQPYTASSSWHIAIEQNAGLTNCGNQANIPVGAAQSCSAAVIEAGNTFNPAIANCFKPGCKNAIEQANPGVTVDPAYVSVVSGAATCAVDPYVLNGTPRTRYQVDLAYQCVYAPPACVAPPPGMVAWYPLGELVGAIAINDVAPSPGSAVNNVGTPTPGPVSPIGPPPAGPTPVPGEVGTALYFYGPYVEVAPQAELDFSTGDFAIDTGVTAFSIDAWVKIVQVGPTLIQPIVDKFGAPGGPGFAFYIRNRNLELDINGNTFVSTGPAIPFSNPLANTGVWTHVAVTVVGGGRLLGSGVFYINGAVAGTFAVPLGSTVNNTLPMWIGETRIAGPRGEIAIDELELFNRAISQAEVQSIFSAGTAGKCRLTCVPPPANMALWYPMEERTGAATQDIVGGRNGTTQAGPIGSAGAPVSVPGKVGNALQFDGLSALVDVSDGPGSLSFAGAFSIDAWVKVASADKAGVRPIVDKRVQVGGAVTGYAFFLYNGAPAVQLADGSVANAICGNATSTATSCTNYFSTIDVADGTWRHVAVTVERTGTPVVTLYVDGVAVFSGTARPNGTDNADLLIGSGYPIVQAKPWFKGAIDELEFFDRALSQAEIKSIVDAGSAGKCKDRFSNYQGLWWNPQESGWGVNFNHQGDTIFATWFTYDPAGMPVWLVVAAQKTAPYVYAGDLYSATGPAWDASPFLPAQVSAKKEGTVTIAVADNDNAAYYYSALGKSQIKNVTRQVFGALPLCTWGVQPNLALATNYQDIWWAAPAGVESGWGVNFTHQGDTIFATWFTYDHAGKPWWLVVSLAKTAPKAYAGDLYTVTSGPPLGSPFVPANVVGLKVGTASLTFADGNAGTFAYTINNAAGSKAVTREVFGPPGTVCQ